MQLIKFVFFSSILLLYAACGETNNTKKISNTPVQTEELSQLTITDSVRFVKVNELNEFCETPFNANVEKKKEKTYSFSSINKTIEQNAFYTINNGICNSVVKNREFDLNTGNNVILAFACNKNGVSCKDTNSYFLKNIVIGEDYGLFNAKQAHMFYYLPGEEAEANNVILDFYLINTVLQADGNNVRVTVNGMEFLLEKWSAYSIEGLEEGTHTIRLELIDKNGDIVPGPFNDSGERVFKVKKRSV